MIDRIISDGTPMVFHYWPAWFIAIKYLVIKN